MVNLTTADISDSVGAQTIVAAIRKQHPATFAHRIARHCANLMDDARFALSLYERQSALLAEQSAEILNFFNTGPAQPNFVTIYAANSKVYENAVLSSA